MFKDKYQFHPGNSEWKNERELKQTKIINEIKAELLPLT